MTDIAVHHPTAEQQKSGAVAAFSCQSADGWTANGSVTRRAQGQLAISDIQITADPDGAISAKVLRAIPLGDILASVLASAAEIDLKPETSAPAQVEPGRPGRAPLSGALLRRVAEGYLAESSPGKPKGAVKRLAEQMNEPQGTVSRWVWRARRDGWLGPAAPGREGAEPGPRLFEARAAELEAKLHAAASELDTPTGE